MHAKKNKAIEKNPATKTGNLFLLEIQWSKPKPDKMLNAKLARKIPLVGALDEIKGSFNE